jgi:hypothetical protein
MRPNTSSDRNLWAVKHQLDAVELVLELPNTAGPYTTAIRAHGRSYSKRTALWSYQEVFEPLSSREKGYGPADALHHIALVAQQDRPRSLAELNLALRGGVSWVQEELDLDEE